MTVFAKRLAQEKKIKASEEIVPVTTSGLHPLHPLIASGQLYYQDPRPDLEEDSNLWLQMFIEADKISKQLQENLWKMRTWGTRIKRGEKGFIIRPDIDEDGIRAWPDQETYEKWRDRLLKPYTKQIKEILRSLFEWEG